MNVKNIVSSFNKNFWYILLVFAGISIFVFSSDRFYPRKKQNAVHDYLTIKSLVERIYAKECLSEENLEKACFLLEKNPELLSQYEGILSLALDQNNNKTKAITFAQNHIKRVDAYCPSFHKEFFKTTLLIADKNYEEALKEASHLEEQLQNISSYPHLRNVNLLRIAFLAQEQKNPTLVKQALKKLKETPSHSLIETLFEEQGFTLYEYFQEVKNEPL